MNNDVRPRKPEQDRLLHLFGDKVRLNERQVVFHFEMKLDKAGRP